MIYRTSDETVACGHTPDSALLADDGRGFGRRHLHRTKRTCFGEVEEDATSCERCVAHVCIELGLLFVHDRLNRDGDRRAIGGVTNDRLLSGTQRLRGRVRSATAGINATFD